MPARGAATDAGARRLAAIILALLLGSFGVHKFYLGRPVQGVIYLLLFWSFVPLLLGLYDGLRLFAMTNQQFVATYGEG